MGWGMRLIFLIFLTFSYQPTLVAIQSFIATDGVDNKIQTIIYSVGYLI
jgi:hypothetical protein